MKDHSDHGQFRFRTDAVGWPGKTDAGRDIKLRSAFFVVTVRAAVDQLDDPAVRPELSVMCMTVKPKVAAVHHDLVETRLMIGYNHRFPLVYALKQATQRLSSFIRRITASDEVERTVGHDDRIDEQYPARFLQLAHRP